MSKNHIREFIISYDIADPKRLQRIHRMLKKLALPLQYSVFYARMSEHQRDKLSNLLERKINPREDDIRIYPLPPKYNIQYLGQEPFIQGLHLSGQGGEWHSVEVQMVLDNEEKRQRKAKSD